MKITHKVNSMAAVVCLAVLIGFLGTACTTLQTVGDASKGVVEYSINVADIKTDLDVLQFETQEAVELVAANWDKFSDEDKANLIVIQENAKNVIEFVGTLKSKDFYTVTTSDIEYIYGIAKYSRALGKKIYEKNAASLQEHERFWFQMYDKDLQRVGEKIQALRDDPESANITKIVKGVIDAANIGVRAASLIL